MSEWSMKRFWSETSIEEGASGFEVKLDGKSVKTPAKVLLSVPTEQIASKIASEWEAQEESVDPTSMPWTRSANAALDKVATQRTEVANHLAEYAASDLLCYRAEGPSELISRQKNAWDPMLLWVADVFGAKLQVTSGVMPITQEAADIDRLVARMRGMTSFQLTGFYDLVTLTGSFVLGLAAAEKRRDREKLWALSRIDEDWQIEQWGEDEEAQEASNIKMNAFFHATEFFHAA